MDCNLKKTEPCSQSQLLYQQVIDQSEVCDVTVKVGHWEKMFHWCVLLASPFFEKMYKNSFKEKQTGQVQLHIGKPSIIEACILFLYGEKPKLTDGNISEFFEVAEFLMIQNLKAMCIKWLKDQSVTTINCYKMLELASTYEFKISKCTKYIRANLPEVLQKKEMLNITKETLEHILSDPRLCYFDMEDKFKYLVSWTKARPERKRHFADVFQLTEFEDMSIQFIENVVKKETLVIEMNQLCECDSVEQIDLRKVVIFNSTFNTLNCLDLQTKGLYKLSILGQNERDDGWLESLTGANAIDPSDVFKLRRGHDYEDGHLTFSTSIIIHNIATDLTMTTKVAMLPENTPIADSIIIVANNECTVIVKTIEEKHTQRKTDLVEAIYMDHEYSSSSFNERFQDGNTYIDVTTIYKGDLQEGVTTVHPMLALPYQNIVDACINNANVVAMLSDYKYTLFLYDQNSCELDTLCLNADYNFKTEEDDKLAPSTEGFVIYNDKRVFCITRLSGPCLQTKYKTYLYEFNNEQEYIVMKFCENLWFRYKQTYSLIEVWSYATHDDILGTEEGREIQWINIQLPDYNVIGSDFVTIFIPRNKSKCHMDCPHCKQNAPTTKSQYNIRIDDNGCIHEYCSDSSSDDDSSDSSSNFYEYLLQLHT